MKKEKTDREETINELVDEYREQLRNIFNETKSKRTFDEIEKLVDEKIDAERSNIISKCIEEEIEKFSKNKDPEQTCLCVCNTEAILCKDKEEKLKIFERTLQTKRGPVKMKEYGYYCSKCRKIFFPSKKRTKSIQRKLQP